MRSTMPEEFVEQVRQVLEHLYDIPYLYQHPLASEWPLSPAGSASSPAAVLRQAVQAAIEALNPGESVSLRAPQARYYQLLHLHFVEGLTVQEVARELALSERQAYRDLRRSTEMVALALWQQQENALAAEPRAVTLSSIDTEVERLETRLSLLDLSTCLDRVSRSVERLAAARGVELRCCVADVPLQIWTYPAAAQQVLTSLISLVVQCTRPGQAPITLVRQGEHVVLEIGLRLEAGRDSLLAHLSPAASTLLSRLNWQVREAQASAEDGMLRVQMEAQGPAVLVIDDNEELLELVARYLSDHAVRVSTASRSGDGLALARTTSPDAIILDVMMPDTDGWEILQTLKTWPETADIPVVICSVFHDPQLAYSLGAASVLAKPVRRSDVLAALRDLGIV